MLFIFGAPTLLLSLIETESPHPDFNRGGLEV